MVHKGEALCKLYIQHSTACKAFGTSIRTQSRALPQPIGRFTEAHSFHACKPGYACFSWPKNNSQGSNHFSSQSALCNAVLSPDLGLTTYIIRVIRYVSNVESSHIASQAAHPDHFLRPPYQLALRQRPHKVNVRIAIKSSACKLPHFPAAGPRVREQVP